MKNSFLRKLLKWHAGNKRNMPWKNTTDPYKIWISEVILQQTRVEQGTSYYEKIVQMFPTVKSLATASEDEVMKAWQGLGYYSRARNMHAASKQIMNDFGGKFPDNFEAMLKLKGVGAYTASAVASFAFNLPHAVVDGNVFRVLSRAFGIEDAIDTTAGKQKFTAVATDLLDKKNPASYNQAIMDFGATLCTPVNPGCTKCFYKNNCVAFKNNLVEKLPFKSKKTAVKIRWFSFFVFGNEEQFIIEKRNANDIWKGLYQFPLIETEKFADPHDALKEYVKHYSNLGNLKIEGVSELIAHKLTHQKIMTQFIRIKINLKQLKLKEDWMVVNQKEIFKYAFPKVIDAFLKKALY